MNILVVVVILISVVILLLVLVLWGIFFRKDSAFSDKINKLSFSVKDNFNTQREEINNHFHNDRIESTNHFKVQADSIRKSISDFSSMQEKQTNIVIKQMDTLTSTLEKRFDKINATIESKLSAIQSDNNSKLEKMRETVDEKLQSTLERRLGESFKLVSERLDMVSRGLGEMQNLASGVGDLKKVLSNVKSRGTLGEYLLENIIEQLLTVEQYEKNVRTKRDSNDVVEFAIKLPGHKDTETVWMPIDSKFPTEDYHVLLDAYDKSDAVLMEKSKKQLSIRIKAFAKDISSKYLDPPQTSDFGIMFLPIEGLYSEVLRIPGLFDDVQRNYKIIITGPTTLSAILNSLQMGFHTLAIEKRTSEVWSLLSTIKTEFGKFTVIIDKTRKKLQEASNVIEKAGSKSRTIENKLSKVEKLKENDDADIIKVSDPDSSPSETT